MVPAGQKELCQSTISTGSGLHGGHAEYMLAYGDATMLIPDSLRYEQAAPIFYAGYTVWSGLRLADPTHWRSQLAVPCPLTLICF